MIGSPRRTNETQKDAIPVNVDKERFQGILADVANRADAKMSKTYFQSGEAKLHLRLLEDAGYVATEDHGQNVRVTAAGFAALAASAKTHRNAFDIYMAALTGADR